MSEKSKPKPDNIAWALFFIVGLLLAFAPTLKALNLGENPITIDSSDKMIREPMLFNIVEPSMTFDGANYHWNTSYGVYTWKQPLNYMGFALPNGTVMIEQSVYVLQENSTGTWLSLLTFRNLTPKIFLFDEDVGYAFYQLNYEITHKLKGQTYVIGHVMVRQKFFVDREPKTETRLTKTEDWFNIGLNHSRWLYDMLPAWKYVIDDANKRNVELENNDFVFLGDLNKTYLAKSQDYAHSHEALLLDWRDVRFYCKTFGGKEPFWNSRGIVVVFPVNLDDIDPTTIYTNQQGTVTKLGNQRKVFRNPRGLHFYYMLGYVHRSSSPYYLRLYRSPDGVSWSDYQLIKQIAGFADYGSSSLWNHDNGTHLLIFMVYRIQDDLFYRRATVNDASSVATLESEQQIFTGTASTNALRPSIAMANDGYVWISYSFYDATGVITSVVDSFDDTRSPSWIETGAYPYLHDFGLSVVSTNVDTALTGDYGFANFSSYTGSTLQLYMKGDGNDWITKYLWDGTTWNNIGTTTPTTSYAWHSQSVTVWLNTIEKANQAMLYLKYSKAGKSNLLYIDVARLQTPSTYKVQVLVSNVIFSPSITDWSTYDIEDVSNSAPVSTVVPLNNTHDVFVLFKYHINRLHGIELSWNGASMSEGYEENLPTVYYAPSDPYILLSAVVDSNNTVHFLHAGVSPAKTYHNTWEVGVGFNDTDGVDIFDGLSSSLAIDLTASPNMLYAFKVSMENITIRNGTLAGVWASPTTIIDNVDSKALYFASASYRDAVNGIQVVYGRSDYHVRFYEIEVAVPPVITIIAPFFIGAMVFFAFVGCIFYLGLKRKR